MKLSVLLFVAPLVLLLSLSGLALCGENSRHGVAPSRVDAYAAPSFYRAPNVPYDNAPYDFGEPGLDRAYVPGDAPSRGYEQNRADPYRGPVPEPYLRQYSDPGYPSYRLPFEDSPYFSGPARRPDAAAGWRDDGYWGSPEIPRGLSPAATQGYRFRGDATDFGRWSGATWQNGYRFRPLTAQERQRRDDLTGWRPQGSEWGREPPQRAGRLATDEAYGYQSDVWFRRYYGERP